MSTIVRNTMPPIVNAVDVIYVYIRIIEINTLSMGVSTPDDGGCVGQPHNVLGI